jgi:hypothetical protein
VLAVHCATCVCSLPTQLPWPNDGAARVGWAADTPAGESRRQCRRLTPEWLQAASAEPPLQTALSHMLLVLVLVLLLLLLLLLHCTVTAHRLHQPATAARQPELPVRAAGAGVQPLLLPAGAGARAVVLLGRGGGQCTRAEQKPATLSAHTSLTDTA